MTKAGWKLLTEGGEPVQVARNSVALKMLKSLSGKITFLDPLSSYLEVVVELPEIVAKVDISHYCQKYVTHLSQQCSRQCKPSTMM